MFRKTTLISLIISAAFFNNVFALTCDVSWQAMPFQEVLLSKGGNSGCFYSDGQGDSGSYEATDNNTYPSTGPWQYIGMNEYRCTQSADMCVFIVQNQKGLIH